MGGFGYPDNFIYENDMFPEAMDTEFLGVFLAVFFIVWFLLIGFSILCYVLNSLGLYTIAERRGIRNGWLAWVPFGSVWILGSISDQYQYVAKGKVKNRRKILLGLTIAYLVVYIMVFVSLFVSAFAGAFPVLALVLGSVAMFVLVIVQFVMTYIAYNDLYTSCNPNNAAMYLVLSIVFSVTMPFFVFACRKKDLGMPPRKQAPVWTVGEPVVEMPAANAVAQEAPVAEPLEEVAEPTAAEEPAEGYAQPEEFEE